jgi:[ribosomal protein S18]-alanine N-acetyltransferase
LTRPLLLEAALEADVPALVALERRSFSHPWSENNFREAVANPDRVSTLVLRGPFRKGAPDRGIVAYCVCQVVVDELHILDLVVAPEARRRGLARWLLEFTLDRAARQGADRAFLEVRRSNTVAIELYRSLGFRAMGERRAYYREPAEDALLLGKEGLSARGGRAREESLKSRRPLC